MRLYSNGNDLVNIYYICNDYLTDHYENQETDSCKIAKDLINKIAPIIWYK